MSGIILQNLSKKFANFVAVDSVSFKVEEGELVALLGPSGSGKSTLLRIIAGLERPDSGNIFLTGKEVTGLRTQKRNVGFVFQHYALFKHMTVEKNIAFGLEIIKKNKKYIKEKVDELINLVRLQGYEGHYPSQLSGGQRQRVALARALAPEPRVLLLDEPFGSLDTKVRKNLAQWLRDLHDRIHVTSIFVTHDQNEAMEIADKIVLINRGRVEQIGTPIEVYEKPKTKFAASFVGNVNVVNAYTKENGIFIPGVSGTIANKSKMDGNEKDIVLLVRPEDISISKEHITENSLQGEIRNLYYRGNHYEINIQLGINTIKSMLHKESYNQHKCKVGESIFVDFKKFKIFDAPEGHDKIHYMLKQLGYIE